MLKSVLWFLDSRILQLEEEYIQNVCSDIIAIKPDVVFTEKGVSGEIIIDHDVNNGCLELSEEANEILLLVPSHVAKQA